MSSLTPDRPDRPPLTPAQVEALAAAVRAGEPVFYAAAGRPLERVVGPVGGPFVGGTGGPQAGLADRTFIDLFACRPDNFVRAVPLFPEAG